MSKKWIFIQPQDVWMFRTSKPFAAGESFVARSSFPPNPQTMQGIIRTHVIEQSGVDWAAFGNRRDESLLEEIGAPATRQGHKASLGKLALRGPLVGYQHGEGVSLLVPTPQDVMKAKADNAQIALLSPSAADFETDAPFSGWQPLGLADTQREYETAGGWLEEAEFERYLQGEVPQRVIDNESIFQTDERTGLAIDYSQRTARDKHLYHAEFVRPRAGVGLLVEIDAALLADSGYIGVGGESRTAYYETVNFQAPMPNPNAQGRLKIVLLTPAYFAQGWHPAESDWSPWLGDGARLVSMALGRPTLISGWDTVNRRPKPLHHYVPAGSVFYFENAQVPQQPFTEPIPDESFEGGLLDAGRLGFGGFAVGIW